MNRCKVLIIILITLYSLLPAILFAQMSWTRACSCAAWTQRYGHTSVVFDNKMWVMGGTGDDYFNDVWYSTDGVNWNQATINAGWSLRMFQTAINYDNKMWVMGGFGYVNLNDVWYSTNGVTWTQVTNNAGWTPRLAHSSTVFNNMMWIIGGAILMPIFPYLVCLNDVWYSSNGVNWTQTNISSPWSVRYCHSTVVYDNKIWVMGGGDTINLYNDVWFSLNGTDWSQATPSANWSPRGGHITLVYDNKMWVMGGYDGVSRLSDVWYSSDGINWTQATGPSWWVGRTGHTALVFDDKMWIMGGTYNGGNGLNDVWYSTGLNGVEENNQPLSAERVSLEIYPNPAKSYFTVRLPQSADRQEIKIYDVTGKVIKELESSGNRKLRISLDGIKNGVYFVQAGDEMVKEKLVVTR